MYGIVITSKLRNDSIERKLTSSMFQAGTTEEAQFASGSPAMNLGTKNSRLSENSQEKRWCYSIWKEFFVSSKQSLCAKTWKTIGAQHLFNILNFISVNSRSFPGQLSRLTSFCDLTYAIPFPAVDLGRLTLRIPNLKVVTGILTGHHTHIC